YDKPLVGNLNRKDNFEHYRSALGALYSNFKSSAEHIELVLLTGVSRFSKLSVFSDLNNLRDITFDNEYADICGITEKELLEYFREGIDRLAAKMEVEYESALKKLKKSYDGYRFAGEGSDIYNPWSLLNALNSLRISSFWTDTGYPILIMESLKRVHADLEKTFNIRCRESALKGGDLLNPDPTSLLYQTGYITIKNYNPRTDTYRLGIPNEEVKRGLYEFLIPYYAKVRRGTTDQLVVEMVECFIEGDPEEAMRALQAFFAGIDYKMGIDNENNFHNALYLLTHIIGLDTKTEVHTSNGSIDLTIDTDDFLYIIELKYDHSAQEALQQIEEKRYARPWQNEDREVFLIGASFSSKTRCIEDWKIKRLI
ncbi:MAG: AAA family ATPase, partial [Muribaculaceae bacterium]|nr:AAA family ATPase [Muribaculaceae bacterium]